MKSKIFSAALLVVLAAGAVRAEEAATGMESMHMNAEKAPAWFEKVKASCWVDAYYQYNLNGRSNTGPLGRAFDTRQQEFAFSGAQLSLSRTDEKSGTSGQLDLLFGPMAAVVQPTLGASSIVVKQALLSQVMGPVTLRMGKFVTFLGTEVIDTPLNLNYSRGNLFLQIPYYHVGLSASYALMEGLGLLAMAGNGNSVDVPSTEDRDYGLQASYTAVKGFSLIAMYYLETVRNAGAGSPVTGNQHYIDLLASYQVAEKLGLSGEYLYKTRIASGEKDGAGNYLTTSLMTDPATGLAVPFSPKWQGYALYVNYATPMEGLSIIPRYEQWWSEGSSTPASDLTLTAKLVQDSLTHALEVRVDSVAPGAFPGAAGTTELLYNQATLTYGATYTF